MAVRYESRAHAVADAAVAVVENLHRVALVHPHTCDLCGRSVKSFNNWQAGHRKKGRLARCGRISWLRLTHCRGRLVRAEVSR